MVLSEGNLEKSRDRDRVLIFADEDLDWTVGCNVYGSGMVLCCRSEEGCTMIANCLVYLRCSCAPHVDIYLFMVL